MDLRKNFGREQARHRRAAGLTQEQLAARMGYAVKTIQHAEQGLRTPTLEYAEKADLALGLDGVMKNLAETCRADGSPFGELKEGEQRATSIRIWDMRFVPGLLQTEEYATALLKEPDDLGDRMERQGIFERDDAPYTHVIICESVLYQEVGGPGVLRRQLEHLTRPDAPWTLQVMSQMAGVHAGVDGPVTFLEFADESPIVFLDNPDCGSVVDDARKVSRYWTQWEQLVADALSPSMAREMIAAVISDLPEGS